MPNLKLECTISIYGKDDELVAKASTWPISTIQRAMIYFADMQPWIERKMVDHNAHFVDLHIMDPVKEKFNAKS